MRKAVAALAIPAILLASCGVIDVGRRDPVEGVPGSSAATPAFTGAPVLDVPVRTLATGLKIPWGLAFLPDGSALVTERGNEVPKANGPEDKSGIARIMKVTPDGKVTEVQRLSEVDRRSGEGGLLGIAVSPTYATDGWVYVYYSAKDDNRIARLKLGQPPQPVVTGIPVSGDGSRYHQGGRLAFGPDGMLYAGVGETYWDSELAQDPKSLGGKILRMTPEGKPAPGNPFPDSLVWSYGHRNVQGLAWDSKGRMYASEFGSKTYDELNVIEPGKNYGWPVVEGFSTDPKYTNPIATWTPTAIASPSGIAILGEHVYLACLAGQTIYRVGLDGRDPVKLVTKFGRIRTVMVAPDGSLWATTSNYDQAQQYGAVPQAAEGDMILRITMPS
ncbi:MAG TPA: PQQ-dependent sugar dehydrogenase [Candidatus Limnocylindrales bacterium]|nr:PQQ-dependent sugar dehydrogenase [Candidatus Limnocylindrales bacterium]